jgi:hypothetical protein
MSVGGVEQPNGGIENERIAAQRARNNHPEFVIISRIRHVYQIKSVAITRIIGISCKSTGFVDKAIKARSFAFRRDFCNSAIEI